MSSSSDSFGSPRPENCLQASSCRLLFRLLLVLALIDEAVAKIDRFEASYGCPQTDMIQSVDVSHQGNEGYITFISRVNGGLPKPSYSCTYTARLDGIWYMVLGDACNDLFEDSDYFFRKGPFGYDLMADSIPYALYLPVGFGTGKRCVTQ